MINCRKICQHCKCPREDHNIIEDDARTGCNVYLGEANHSGLPSDDDSGCALDEYAWVPPGLNPEQASGVNLERLSYLHVLFFDKKNIIIWYSCRNCCYQCGSHVTNEIRSIYETRFWKTIIIFKFFTFNLKTINNPLLFVP